MSQKWNLQDIRPAGAKKVQITREPVSAPRGDIAVRKPPRPVQPQETFLDPDIASIDILDGNSERRKRTFISLAIVLVILVIGFFLNSLMSGAEIVVHPKYKDVTVQATFTAYTEPQAGDLSYELLSLEATGERQVAAAGEQLVSERAVGKILIYNEFSTAPQRLIKNTRFANSDGLIYRISESVEVPGTTKDQKGGIIPGVISADVFADGTGEQYNIGPTRFSVPGLAGSEQADKIYGESTVAFAGGYEGTKFVIDEAEFKTAEQALQLELRNSLLARLDTEKPADFILYKDAVTFVFDSLPATEYGDGMATIKERARLQVPIFAKSEFAEYLAKNTISGFEKTTVETPDPLTLTFSYTGPTTTISDISVNKEVEFLLKGQTRILWTFDEEKLKKDVATKPKTALAGITTGYPALTKIEAKVRPFWKQSFPEDTSKITITTIVAE